VEWNEEDGKEEEKEEEQRKGNKPTKDELEGKDVTSFIKNIFQPLYSKMSCYGALSVAGTLQGGGDLKGKPEVTMVLFFFRGWLCFNDSEEEDNAKWEHDKEVETEE